MRVKRYGSMVVAILMALGILLASPILVAQSTTTGDINGTVTDSSGAILPNTTVTLKSADTGVSQTTKTNSGGYYHFPLLKPGDYTVTAEAPGMQATSKGVAVLIGQVAQASLQLGVKGQATTVEVTDEAPLLQTENANLATSYSSKQLDLLPNGGNDITQYAQTSPGILINTSTGGGLGNFTSFGLPGTANLFTVNGNDEMEPYLSLNNSGATNLTLGANELQEVTVVSNGYTGQYGRNAGAQVDYATKSGTNSWHGNTNYEYTGSGISANDWFLNHSGTPLGKEVNNQYSASIGGPIKKDKLFFFVDTEGLRYTLGSSNLTFLPTQAFENAIINTLNGSATTFGGIGPKSVPFYQSMINLWNGTKITGNLLPSGALGASNFGCGDLNLPTTVAGNGGFFNPELAAFGDPAAVTGTPGVTGGQSCTSGFFSNVSNSSTEWLLAGHVDWNASDKDKVAIRYKNDIGNQPTYTDPISPVFNAFSHQPWYEGQATWNRVISPTLVNQLIVSGSWYSAFFSAEPGAKAAFPYSLETFDLPLGGTNQGVDLAMGGENLSFPQGRNVTQYQIVDDVSWQRGNHTFKFGENYRRDDITDGIFGVRSEFPRARIFSTTDFVNGFIDQFSQRFPSALTQPIANYSLGTYLQDEWRVTPNLKLTMALRADHNSNAVCQHDCISNTVSPFGSLTKDPNQPYNSFLIGGQHQAFHDIEKAVLQPRFGFTFSPLGRKSTVVRGGIGLFADLYPGALIDDFAGNPPGRQTFTLAGLPFSPAEAGNAASTVAGCNTAFLSNYEAGGNDASFLAAAPAGCREPDVFTAPSVFKNPKYLEYNLEVQQSFGQKTSVSVNYVGNHGYDELLFSPSVNAFCTVANCPKGFGGLPTTRPDRSFRNVSDVTNNGYSNYNGLTVSAVRKFSYGFQGKLNYTYSHTLDTVSNGSIVAYSNFDSDAGQINPFNLNLNYGNADYDVRHNITADYIWELPYKSSNRLMDAVMGGWSVSGTVFWHTGYPFSVNDSALASVLGDNVNAISSNSATFLGGIPFDTCNGRPSTGTASTTCMSASSFLPSGTETGFGNLARNSFRGPGYFNTDFTLNKNFKISERVGFRLGVNLYNALNHASFNNPSHDIGSTPFGQYFTAASPPTSPYGSFTGSSATARILQVSGKITF